MPYAIITGATQGIGKAIAEKLLAEGFSIAVCARTKTDLEHIKKVWEKKYPATRIIALQADVSEKKDVVSFANAVLGDFPQIDVIVNNAGIFLPGALADESEGHLEKLMTVNMYSAYHLTRQVLPQMKKQKSGHIFNICSVASLQAYPNGGSYGITKYALLGFSENLREELKPDKIKVTAVCPGATYSRSWGNSELKHTMMDPGDVANMLWSAYTLSANADVETIIMRPTAGDL